MHSGANAIRGGINASAEFQKEIFKQKNANIQPADRLRIAAVADRLTTQYPSAGLVNVMELARASQSMMGSVDRGLSILPDLVRGYVALQTTMGTDTAPGSLRNLLRGIDNAGKNKDWQLGIDAIPLGRRLLGPLRTYETRHRVAFQCPAHNATTASK